MISPKRKKMGRPSVGSSRILVAMSTAMVDSLDAWRASRPGVPGRAEAIRQIVTERLNHGSRKGSGQ